MSYFLPLRVTFPTKFKDINSLGIVPVMYSIAFINDFAYAGFDGCVGLLSSSSSSLSSGGGKTSPLLLSSSSEPRFLQAINVIDNTNAISSITVIKTNNLLFLIFPPLMPFGNYTPLDSANSMQAKCVSV